MGVLQKKVVSGFIWTSAEKIGSMLLKLLVSYVLLDKIAPDQHGLIALLMPFYLAGATLTDGGFDQALIQRKKISDTDYSSVFFFNIIISLILYGLLVGLSLLLAGFYEAPMLRQLSPWLFAAIPIGALGLVQQSILNREMRFAQLSKIHITANLLSSAITLYMVLTGWDIWSLVSQIVALQVVRVAMFWIISPWRPKEKFSILSIKSLFSYGSNILFANLISRFFGSLSQLVIGKIYGTTRLGFYDKALKLEEETSSTIQLSILSVTFPAFSQLQDENEKLKIASRKVIAVISLVLFPAMAGLIMISPEIFGMLLPQWMQSVPYFQIFCLSAFFLPPTYVCLNIIKAKGASRTVLKLEIIKKAFAIAVIALTAAISVKAMVVGYVIWMAFEMGANILGSHRFIKYPLKEILKDTLPYLGMTAVMFGAAIGMGLLFPELALWQIIIVKIITSAIVYLGLNLLFRPAAWIDSLGIVRSLAGKGR